MTAAATSFHEPTLTFPQAFVQWFVQLVLIFLLVGEAAPGVNESHYLPKAKHAWDTSFAPGDLFLESHDSHLLASLSAGIPAQTLPLAVVAWCGRVISWGFLSLAWISLSRSLKLHWMVTPIALGAWIVATRAGHWAGEWAVGGFEAKAIAYPCVLLGIAAAIEDRWGRAWIWLAAAVAWHPVVGGWAGLSVGIVWLIMPNLRTRFSEQFLYLCAAVAIGLVGVVPAATGISGPNQVDKVVASQIHVYMRLPHHLSPRLFAFERHVAAIASLTVLAVTTIGYLLVVGKRVKESNDYADSIKGMKFLLSLTWLAVGFALIGLLIDVFLSPYRPSTASSLLRFYWFRWADVAVPLAVTMALFQLTRYTGNAASAGSKLGATSVILAGILAAGFQVQANWKNSTPAADVLVVSSTGPRVVQSDRYTDWLAVCDWIRNNTPEDSLWLTPKYQQSFKWYAHRAEVVCWKDVPQDNQSVHQWYERILACEPPRNSEGRIRQWTGDELLTIARKYDSPWILLDKTVQIEPPEYCEILYPGGNVAGKYEDNRSFAAVRILDVFMDDEANRQ